MAIHLTTSTPDDRSVPEEPQGVFEEFLDTVGAPEEAPEDYVPDESEPEPEPEAAPPEEEETDRGEAEERPERERPRREDRQPDRAPLRPAVTKPAERTEPPREEKKPSRLKREAPAPKSAPAQTKPAQAKPAPAPAPAAYAGRLAVVIDDGGRDLASQKIYEAMGIPLTLAVMPNQPHTREAAASWAAAGLPVIIHQPMESMSGTAAEEVFISTAMTAEQQERILRDSFAQIPQAVGMNNHQGSKATTHRTTMNNVMKALAARHMFFLDSATNRTTAADAAAAAYGVPYARNELFVDNSTDVEEIKAMIRKGARMAKGGTAIIIGHCRPHTAEAFRQVVPELRAEGIQFVYVSSLTH